MFVGVATDGAEPLTEGRWMHFFPWSPAATLSLEPGRYRAVFIDGVFGVWTGRAKPIVQSFEVAAGADNTIRFLLGSSNR